MTDLDQVRSSIERAVSQRLTQQADQFRKDVVDQVLREIEPLLASSTGSGQAQSQRSSAVSGLLSSTISAIQASTAQTDILKALLEGVSKFSPRTALFVVRGTALAGWQARGFADDNIRGLTLDGSRGLAARAIQDRGRVSGAATDFDSVFIQKHGAPADRSGLVFPLVVRDKVAAILYCDTGSKAASGADSDAIEVLTRYTCLWLELAAGKKTSAADSNAAAVSSASSEASAVASAPTAEFSATALTGVTPAGTLSADEQELHKKAQRFAKLLVDEIKLYNQSKVAEGKQNRDLYKVLREDIEKSRATYDKRYGGTPVATARYFDSEVVRILADNDRSLMGSDFPA